jgi:polyisoprenoid-binding protein YceI
MRYKQFVWASAASLLVAAAAPGADRYQIDPAHTQIGFSVRHLVISNVQGKFNEFSGTILYDGQDTTKSSVSVTIKAASIDTGVEQRDSHLRSADFFDAAKYPEVTFQSTRIEKRGEGYVALGTLTMHGVAKEVALPFAIAGPIKDPLGKQRMGVEASLTINRQDWGIAYSQTLDNGGLLVGNDVKIELNVEAVQTEGRSE